MVLAVYRAPDRQVKYVSPLTFFFEARQWFEWSLGRGFYSKFSSFKLSGWISDGGLKMPIYVLSNDTLFHILRNLYMLPAYMSLLQASLEVVATQP